ncbi:hypothetical protein LJR090_002380 [Bosea sp. LjRoot90]|uniref:hypothetical protein n=1 Tax=Bosea sp. LjRoot90 TaxID=3342342 RepID=UPI003ECE0362
MSEAAEVRPSTQAFCELDGAGAFDSADRLWFTSFIARGSLEALLASCKFVTRLHDASQVELKASSEGPEVDRVEQGKGVGARAAPL